ERLGDAERLADARLLDEALDEVAQARAEQRVGHVERTGAERPSREIARDRVREPRVLHLVGGGALRFGQELRRGALCEELEGEAREARDRGVLERREAAPVLERRRPRV